MRTPGAVWTVATLSLAVALSSAACGSPEGTDPNDGTGGNSTPGSTTTAPGATDTPASSAEQVKQILDARKADYGEALRTASLKLRDALPSMDEIKSVDGAADEAGKKVAYEKLVDTMIADPKFNAVMIKFFKDTFRTGQVGAIQAGMSSKDTAANFAAQVVVEGRSWKEIFTATADTCPTYDMTTNAFVAGTCTQGPAGGQVAGVLSDPGLQSAYFANMAFRRARFIQETFVCSKYPAEYSKAPVPMGNGTFTGAQSFDRITGKKNTPAAKIDFQDTSAVICANCHTTLNGIAPLFISFDDKGLLQMTPQVEVPIPGTPKASINDYLVPGKQDLSWRLDKPITDLTSLGAAMAADPDVSACAVNRVWNYALSRGDIVNDLATIPKAVTESYVKDFDAGGQKLKETIRAVFKSEDFVKF